MHLSAAVYANCTEFFGTHRPGKGVGSTVQRSPDHFIATRPAVVDFVVWQGRDRAIGDPGPVYSSALMGWAEFEPPGPFGPTVFKFYSLHSGLSAQYPIVQ